MAFKSPTKQNDYVVVRRLLCCPVEDGPDNARHVMEPSFRGYRRDGKLLENVPCNICPRCGYKTMSDPVRILVDHTRGRHIEGLGEDFITAVCKLGGV